MLTALVSIHDVMPESRSAVTQLLNTLHTRIPQLKAEHITLLVVPGRQWRSEDVDWLGNLACKGHPLAGHGWSHYTDNQKRTVYHHLHSLLLSRNAAEHLSRPLPELLRLVTKCFEWFPKHGFTEPKLYVPPAWATGCLRLKHWQSLPFCQLETLSGITHISSGQHYSLPLTGYEADTPWRAASLKAFNQWNKLWAQVSNRAIRISLHPYDGSYLLAESLIKDIQLAQHYQRYDLIRAE